MWTFEQIYSDGDGFFDALTGACRSARTSIDIETYIFQRDALGERLASELTAAAGRGVAVRLVVDGVGSIGWISHFGERMTRAGVRYRVFHRMPWDTVRRARPFASWMTRLPMLFRSVNRRDHRKLYLFDRETAFAGSMNVSATHLDSVMGAGKGWRDLGVALRGPGCASLLEAFEYTWRRHRWLPVPKTRSRRLTQAADGSVRVNTTRKLRRHNFRDLLRRIDGAAKRVWITTPYFVPNGPLLRSLEAAAGRGVDVRILVPGPSDVFFMPWVAAAFEIGLLRAGAKMFRYTPRVLHAKSLIIDDWMTIGSSNMNHRSLFHDLECDVVLFSDASHRELAKIFTVDCEHAVSVTEESGSRWQRNLGTLLLWLRWWL